VRLGRKRAPLAEKTDEAEGLEIVGEDADEPIDDVEDEADAAERTHDDESEGDVEDWRADGPFDYDEVELSGDEVARIDLGTLIVTPWDGLGLQLQVDEQTRQVRSVTGVWHDSGIELVLFAAPASGGLADDLRAEAVEEARNAGGSADIVTGEFGPELRTRRAPNGCCAEPCSVRPPSRTTPRRQHRSGSCSATSSSGGVRARWCRASRSS